MFPPTYIPNDAERVSLYRELDNMEEERDILAFTERLKDRFGKIPKEGKELIRIVRLRRMAKKLGMEKVVLKKGQMNICLLYTSYSDFYIQFRGFLQSGMQHFPPFGTQQFMIAVRDAIDTDIPDKRTINTSHFHGCLLSTSYLPGHKGKDFSSVPHTDYICSNNISRTIPTGY